ncbi:FAD-binding oxidoreductase [Pseudoponticoccus marisrubri]|uniref:D-lactate dehydrogenase (cytochrome) n=1 Tax=Pseudoponticoccus marisrubri TaxID=1685382 RepID=A0A0W7WNK9_9RHOB|nr:FAD-linked oxidase C-terminal domain-containing protein [Pseudoponticoccus marisrubri]KUF12113.1 2-hydroxy-acid oxidase [Pseudoponticoccus marisrubri]
MPHETALSRLAALLGDRLVNSQADRRLHGQNESHYPEALPEAVAYPESTQEVSEILTICHETGCPVTACGAGSSLEGQHLPLQGGISLDMGRMNKVRAISAEDLNCTVQPGLTRQTLNTALRDTGLFFPVDPGADATLGGMAATRASGTTAVRYGTMRDAVLALEAVMADGTVIRTGSRARKSSTGYDLTHLLVGSEGTLGIITELTLRLQGQPEAISAATCHFDSIEDAVNCVILTIQSGLPMARIELLDHMMVRGFNLHAGAGLPEKPHLFLEFHGSAASVAEQAESFAGIAAEFGADGWQSATRPEDRTALWRMRHNAHYASAALRKGGRVWATDICVPISQLAEGVLQAQCDAERLGLSCTIVGHVGDGNFHAGLSVDPDDPAEMARAAEFSHALGETALRLGGTVSGEHGIGIGKQGFMAAEHGPALTYMRAIKQAFDPNGILNPGKMLPDGPA